VSLARGGKPRAAAEGLDDEADPEKELIPSILERESLVLLELDDLTEKLYPLSRDIEGLPERAAHLHRAVRGFAFALP
jgi:hypothetical protein